MDRLWPKARIGLPQSPRETTLGATRHLRAAWLITLVTHSNQAVVNSAKLQHWTLPTQHTIYQTHHTQCDLTTTIYKYIHHCISHDLDIHHEQKMYGTALIIFNPNAHTSMKQSTRKQSTSNTHKGKQTVPTTPIQNIMKFKRAHTTPTHNIHKSNQVVPFRTWC